MKIIEGWSRLAVEARNDVVGLCAGLLAIVAADAEFFVDQQHVGRLADAVLDEGRWQQAALAWPATVIGGGTPNVQKNIIAERMLGLPKD